MCAGVMNLAFNAQAPENFHRTRFYDMRLGQGMQALASFNDEMVNIQRRGNNGSRQANRPCADN